MSKSHQTSGYSWLSSSEDELADPCKRRRILVVEDEALVAADLEARLEVLGFEVCGVADTCDSAITDARDLQPDLVLMDINLIGPRDGIDAAVEIRKSSGIPIIFITAYADDATLARIRPADPFGYIVKPFAQRDLKTTIEVAFYRKQAEVQRSNMEGWLAITLSSIGDGVIATDLDRKVKFINPMAAGITGWMRGTALGRNITEVFALRKGGKDISISDLLDLAFKRRATTYLEEGHSLVLKDGRTLPVADSIALIRDDRGAISGWVINFRDVTALFATEVEGPRIEMKLIEAERRETLSNLAGGVAHGFNNLLHVIVTGSSLSRAILDELRGAEDLRQLRELLDHIEGAADKGAHLCDQLLAFAGRKGLETKNIALTAFIRDASDLLGTTVAKNANLVFDLADELPLIRADVSQLQQVLMNLVINASEALEGKPGSIAIATDRLKADATSFSQYQIGRDLPAGDYVLLKVTDTGCGMSPDFAARIFDPFFTTKSIGRGLGMAAVAGIIRSLGSALRVESTIGRGTSFQVALPSVNTELGELPAIRAFKSAWKWSGTALLVDDEPAIRTTCGLLLKHLGFTVESAENGREALAMVRKKQGHYRFVCMDIIMPEMSGHAAFKAMRAEFPALPIILMSGYIEDSDGELFDEEQPTAVLQKPFSRQDLTDLLSRILT
jgi:two-component system cell cycle sensor histidine kinase/response regulator CckA